MKFQFLEKTICCMNVGFPPYFIPSTILSLKLIDNSPFSVDIGIDGAFSAGWSSHFWRSLARCSVLANRLQILIYWIGSYSLCNTGIFQCFADCFHSPMLEFICIARVTQLSITSLLPCRIKNTDLYLYLR